MNEMNEISLLLAGETCTFRREPPLQRKYANKDFQSCRAGHQSPFAAMNRMNRKLRKIVKQVLAERSMTNSCNSLSLRPGLQYKRKRKFVTTLKLFETILREEMNQKVKVPRQSPQGRGLRGDSGNFPVMLRRFFPEKGKPKEKNAKSSFRFGKKR